MTPLPVFAQTPDPSVYTFYLPTAVGLGVGLTILVLVFVMKRRRRGFVPPAVAEPPPYRAGEWEYELRETSFADRRTAVRRDGKPVKVLVSSPSFRAKVDSGYVLDRSTGGLRIALATAVTPGSALQVRAHHAPDTIPWVTVVVRNCRHAGRHYELGCEFDQTPPWNVLLLFG
jgi:hypothetical protein